MMSYFKGNSIHIGFIFCSDNLYYSILSSLNINRNTILLLFCHVGASNVRFFSFNIVMSNEWVWVLNNDNGVSYWYLLKRTQQCKRQLFSPVLCCSANCVFPLESALHWRTVNNRFNSIHTEICSLCPHSLNWFIMAFLEFLCFYL